MVKNTTGGSKAKSQARKLVSHGGGGGGGSSALRLSSCFEEQYACVTKMYGNGRCAVSTTDGKELQCVIRGKMRGKLKRHNIISVGSVLLVGLREWEGPTNYKNCDVLEVYDIDEVSRLKTIPSVDISSFATIQGSETRNASAIDLEFTNITDTYLESVKAQVLEGSATDGYVGAEDEAASSADIVNIDDI
jgi:initiation factor 1A